MSGRLVRTEEIYDALFDDDAFSALTSRVAASVDAPSWIVGWIYRDGTQILPDAPRDWSPDLLSDYAQNFAAIDPWTIGSAKTLRPGEVMDLAQVVSPSEWRRSELYNEFLRPNRLDLMHCVQVSAQNPTGMGCFAFHRERQQPSFSEEAVAGLTLLAPHLERMLALKAKLQRLQLIEQMSQLALDALPHALFVVTSSFHIVMHNYSAERHLRKGALVRHRDGRLEIDCRNADQLRAAVAAATAAEGTMFGSVLVESADGTRLVASVIPRSVRGVRCAMLWLQRLGDRVPPVSRQLSLLFGLTPAEAAVAKLLAEGRSPAEVAMARATSTETVRSQIKSLSGKMACRRVSEVVAMVRSIPSVL